MLTGSTPLFCTHQMPLIICKPWNYVIDFFFSLFLRFRRSIDITQYCDTTKETNVTYLRATNIYTITEQSGWPSVVFRRPLCPFTGLSDPRCVLSESLWPCTISVPKARGADVPPAIQVRAITRRTHGRSLAAFKSHPLSETGEH